MRRVKPQAGRRRELDDSERMDSKLNFWLPDALHEMVKAKARQESVNVSALIRTWLWEWVEGKRAGIQDRTETE